MDRRTVLKRRGVLERRVLGRIEVFWRGGYSGEWRCSGEEGARENRDVLERRVLGRIEVFWRGGCSGE